MPFLQITHNGLTNVCQKNKNMMQYSLRCLYKENVVRCPLGWPCGCPYNGGDVMQRPLQYHYNGQSQCLDSPSIMTFAFQEELRVEFAMQCVIVSFFSFFFFFFIENVLLISNVPAIGGLISSYNFKYLLTFKIYDAHIEFSYSTCKKI